MVSDSTIKCVRLGLGQFSEEAQRLADGFARLVEIAKRSAIKIRSYIDEFERLKRQRSALDELLESLMEATPPATSPPCGEGPVVDGPYRPSPAAGPRAPPGRRVFGRHPRTASETQTST